jgi:EAL domain-containing protein (putative c-di-GMP-specific phosphodiesterase class I)/CheY-like chemotaxis protein
VLLADEPGLARSALGLLLESRPEFDLTGVAGNAAEALRLCCIHRPSAVLIGRMLPGGSTTAIREIRQAVPEINVLAYTAEGEPRGVREAVEAGAMSYVVRDEQDEEVLAALRAAAAGRPVLSAAAASAVVGELHVAPSALRERHRRARRRARLEQYIRGDGLSVVLQPIFDLAKGTATSFEALARFNGGGSEGPSVWFAEAAAEDLGAALELAAARTALAAFDELPGEALLGINVSPHVAALPEFAEIVDGVPAHRLVLELTEHAAVEDYAALSTAFGQLRARGLRVAVDDAGAGFASLRHVLMIEPDYLKLDISLCTGIASDRSRRALARALVAFGLETGTETIAEGVESAEDLATLTDLGVRYAQGYHLAMPRPVQELGGGYGRWS